MDWNSALRSGIRGVRTLASLKDKDWRGRVRSLPLGWKIVGGGVVVAVVGVFLALILAISLMAGAAASVTSVVDRVPGGSWFDASGLRSSGNPDLADSDDIDPADAFEIRALLDQEPELMACLSDAPPVTSEAVSLYIANDQEKQDIIAFQERLRQEYIDQENARRQAAAEQGRPVRDTTRPRDPSASLPPYLGRVPATVVPEGADRGLVREDLSPSAFINPDLISTQPAVVAAGQQIRQGNRMTSEVNRAIDEVPTGSHVGAAQTYLLVAFAGGVTSWDHFVAVVEAMGYEQIQPGQTIEVAERFFAPGADFAPYVRAVNAAVISLAMDGVVSGSVATASQAFTRCGS